MSTELVYTTPATEAPSPAEPGTIAATMVDRLLMFVRQGPRFSALIASLAGQSDRIRDVITQITEAFGLEDAVGEQLDRLGAILQRPRLGATDARYRALLRIQVELILSSTASTRTLLEVIRLFTGHEATSYQEIHPMRIVVGAQVPPADVTQLLQLLHAAKAGAVALTLSSHDANVLLLDYTPANPVDGAGTLDYTPADPIAEAGTLAYQETL